MAAAVECEDFMDAVAEGNDSIDTVVEDEDLIAAMGVRKNTRNRKAGNNVHITTSRPDVSDSKGSTCTWL